MGNRHSQGSRGRSLGRRSHPNFSEFLGLRLDSSPTVVGSGLIALDILVSPISTSYAQRWAGGSCANVLAILSYLGWESHPVGRLGKDWSAKEIKRDLAKWGVRLNFVQSDVASSTPIVLERLAQDGSRGPHHSFDWRCPRCMSWFPRYKPIKLSMIEPVLASVEKAQVFYFDKLAPAVIKLATTYRDAGALVIFEPNSVSNTRLFKQAVSLCHILKYSNERMGNKSGILSNGSPLLQIETLGQEGLRFQFRDEQWQYLDAFILETFEDESGAGDWVTAGLLHVLGREGEANLESRKLKEVEDALQFGQCLAAINCQYSGARGAMYALPRNEIESKMVSILKDSNPDPQALGLSRAAERISTNSIFGKVCPECKV